MNSRSRTLCTTLPTALATALATAMVATLLALLATILGARSVAAQDITSQIVITGPAGSDRFGLNVVVLANGNFVVTDPWYDAGATEDVGAVHLYDGVTHELISTLTGSATADEVGVGNVYALPNGNFVVNNYEWNSATAQAIGAVTWCSGTLGCSGVVSAANSLVGGTAFDKIGLGGITVLPNSAYVVHSYDWDSDTHADVGAVTPCSGVTGCVPGLISASNSIVGGSPNDSVGSTLSIVLASGDYVVVASDWDNGPIGNAGAVRRCSGSGGCVGELSISNSLVGTTTDDRVGRFGVFAFTNGDYVVASADWWNGAVPNAGAVTYCANAGCTGAVTSANSLVGTKEGDFVGGGSVVELANGNYVVTSLNWGDGITENVGAATFCSGASPCTGPVILANSLVGSQETDHIGLMGVFALPNGNYVVASPSWSSTVSKVGAVTFCNGTTGCVNQLVTTANSLVGSTADDNIGRDGIVVLDSGAYVVGSTLWDNGSINEAGALTRCNPTTGCPPGPVTQANSLVGASPFDVVGNAVPLMGGGYVARVPRWDDGAIEDVGLVVRCGGASGCTGIVSDTDALKGTTAGDEVGSDVIALANGNYVVSSPAWDRGALEDAGAVTWCDRSVPCLGPISDANSLVGTQASDFVGTEIVIPLANGNYVVPNPVWNNGARLEVGAVTLGNGRIGTRGEITTANSVVGQTEFTGSSISHAFNKYHQYLIVGLPDDRRVVLYALTFRLDVDMVGTGQGIVQSDPPGLVCAVDSCAAEFNGTTVVTLTAVADTGSTFTAWDDACAGTPVTDSCVVTMDQARLVGVTFTADTTEDPPVELTVTKSGAGQGLVTGTGINCGADCSETLPLGTVVTLTATSAVTSTFTGWSGDCSGSGACSVIMDAPRAVTATFALISEGVTVTIPTDFEGGSVVVEEVNTPQAGNMTQAASPAAVYPIGTVLRFTAVPEAGFKFDTWGGDLTGSQNPLEQEVTAPLVVGATFSLITGEDARTYLPIVSK